MPWYLAICILILCEIQSINKVGESATDQQEQMRAYVINKYLIGHRTIKSQVRSPRVVTVRVVAYFCNMWTPEYRLFYFQTDNPHCLATD